MAYSGATDCPVILRAYADLCRKGSRDEPDDRQACQVVEEVAASQAPPAAKGGP